MRRVEQVEDSNLIATSALCGNGNLAEQAEFPVRVAWTAHRAPRRRSESSFGHRLECQRIEVGVTATDASQDLHVIFDLIGAL